MAVDKEIESQKFVSLRERLIVTVIVGLFGAVVFWEGTRQVEDSAIYPLVVGAAIMVLSLFSILGIRIKPLLFTDEAPLKTGFLGLVLVGVFIALSASIGFLTASLIFLPAMAYLGGERRKLAILLGTIVFIIGAYLVFNLMFSHPFPAELIFGEL